MLTALEDTQEHAPLPDAWFGQSPPLIGLIGLDDSCLVYSIQLY